MTMILTGSGTGTVGVPNSATAQSATGTAVNFIGIPAGVKRITVMFSGVSTSGTSLVQIQLGNGSVVTTGYASTAGYYGAGSYGTSSATTGFHLSGAGAPNAKNGSMILQLISGNTWISNHAMGNSAGDLLVLSGGGNIALGGTLDRIRVTTVNGTDTFDAGSINILYE